MIHIKKQSADLNKQSDTNLLSEYVNDTFSQFQIITNPRYIPNLFGPFALCLSLLSFPLPLIVKRPIVDYSSSAELNLFCCFHTLNLAVKNYILKKNPVRVQRKKSIFRG